MSVPADRYSIRPLTTMAEYRACVDLQEATWGEGFSERVSPAILKVSQILGGVVAGAFDGEGALVGFVFGLTGVRDGRTVHWSDMLAILPGLRDAGLGRRLKEYQREDLLSRGIDTMYWTFDPLQSRNANLNIRKLGVVVREYRANMYGESDSPLHLGIGTDRFVALWLMDSERVRRRLAGDDDPGVGDAPFALTERDDAEMGHPEPGLPQLDLEGNDAVRVSIPSDVGSLMSDDMELAQAWRDATRAAFECYMSKGFEVVEFERGRRVSAYLLARAPDAGS